MNDGVRKKKITVPSKRLKRKTLNESGPADSNNNSSYPPPVFGKHFQHRGELSRKASYFVNDDIINKTFPFGKPFMRKLTIL